MTSSLTALALAPGVLKTTTPSLAHSSRGMLLTPAPARAMATSSGFLSICAARQQRLRMLRVGRLHVRISHLIALGREVPMSTVCEMAFSRVDSVRHVQRILLFELSQMKSASARTPSMGMAL